MIVAFDTDAYAWIAAGNGPLRPIVIESNHRAGAVTSYGAAFQNQLAEEYAFEQSMSHLSDISDANHTPSSGYNYER